MIKLTAAFVNAGRELAELQLPLAWKWCELEVARVDTFSAWQRTPNNKTLHAMFMSTTRLQVAVEKQLGMTPSVRSNVQDDESMRFLMEAAGKRTKAIGAGQ